MLARVGAIDRAADVLRDAGLYKLCWDVRAQRLAHLAELAGEDEELYRIVREMHKRRVEGQIKHLAVLEAKVAAIQRFFKPPRTKSG